METGVQNGELCLVSSPAIGSSPAKAKPMSVSSVDAGVLATLSSCNCSQRNTSQPPPSTNGSSASLGTLDSQWHLSSLVPQPLLLKSPMAICPAVGSRDSKSSKPDLGCGVEFGSCFCCRLSRRLRRGCCCSTHQLLATPADGTAHIPSTSHTCRLSPLPRPIAPHDSNGCCYSACQAMTAGISAPQRLLDDSNNIK